MRKAFYVLLVFALLLCMASCMKSPGSIDESQDMNTAITPSPDTPSPPETDTLLDNDEVIPGIYDLEFSDLTDLIFWFSSGVGAWSTELKIMSDGTFKGYFYDVDMGDGGTDYPNGTKYECSFSGNFTSLKKIGDYEYSIKCESITVEGIVGEEKIIDNVKIITSKPYGFDNADEFLLYLPGKKLDELPEEFLGWVRGGYINPDDIAKNPDILSFYGLYNVGGEQGFSAYNKH